MPEQLLLDFPQQTAFGRKDFFVSDANRAAVALIDGWQTWPGGKAVLTGPAGAGKSHMARIWADMASARVVGARDLVGLEIDALATGPLVIEDVPEVAGAVDFDRALFHLINQMGALWHPLLMTGTGVLDQWGVALPDLASRLAAAGYGAIGAPDDGLLAAVMVKQCFDRQLEISPDVLRYVLARNERSFSAAHAVIVELDRMSLREKRPVGQRMAGRALDAIAR